MRPKSFGTFEKRAPGPKLITEIEPFVTKGVILSRKKDVMSPWVIQISSGLNPVCVSCKSQKKETDDIPISFPVLSLSTLETRWKSQFLLAGNDVNN